MMKRILTGIQSSDVPHLGNLLGAIIPSIALAKEKEAFFFIADLHTLTSQRDKKKNVYATQATAAIWLACGLDTTRHFFYRQSRIPEVCELAWYLNCFTPYPMLANAHAFKSKAGYLASVNAGLFTYPVLMAADILLYDATHVPVGKDQLQHLEITKDIATSFNQTYGDIFCLPTPYMTTENPLIPGTDGRKMSKSYGNTINVFAEEAVLKKQIMSIMTDSTPLEKPKDPTTCCVFALYRRLASQSEIEEMSKRYKLGGYGYGHAKKALFSLILERFSEERKAFSKYMDHPDFLEEKLVAGEEKARKIAYNTLQRVRSALGYK